MIQEDYVSFEVAKLLKEKGFDQYFSCKKSYADGIGVWVGDFDKPEPDFKAGEFVDNNNRPTDGEEIAAPTLQMAMKWLRKKHNIGIFPSLFAFCVGKVGAAKPTYGTKIISLKSCELLTDDVNPMPTYEEACEAAIKYSLENLI